MMDTGAPGCNVNVNGGTDCGYNVDTSTSELAHMYHVTLGNKSKANTLGQPQAGFGLTNSGPFVIPDSYFWTSLEYAPRTSLAWDFEVVLGQQVTKNKTNDLYAWVVRDGDVAAVPEPESWALALAGLGIAGLASRRKF
jgi:MYXO-CTERM domain-containing protein